jgi:hypothetical protein
VLECATHSREHETCSRYVRRVRSESFSHKLDLSVRLARDTCDAYRVREMRTELGDEFSLACARQAFCRRVAGMPPVMDLIGNQIEKGPDTARRYLARVSGERDVRQLIVGST